MLHHADQRVYFGQCFWSPCSKQQVAAVFSGDVARGISQHARGHGGQEGGADGGGEGHLGGRGAADRGGVAVVR